MLCLLLITLTATVSAAYFTNHFSPDYDTAANADWDNAPVQYIIMYTSFHCKYCNYVGNTYNPESDGQIELLSITYPANGNYHSMTMTFKIPQFTCKNKACKKTTAAIDNLSVTFTNSDKYFCHSGDSYNFLKTEQTVTTDYGTIDFKISTNPKTQTLTRYHESEPNCTTDGFSQTCYYCSFCKKYFNNKAGDGDALAEATVKRPALGHKYTDNTKPGVCTVCNYQAEACFDDVYYDTFEDALAAYPTYDPQNPIDVFCRYDNKPLAPDKSCSITINNETVSVSKIQPASDDLTVSIGNYGTIGEIAVAGTMSIYNNCVDYYKRGGNISTITMPGDGNLTIKSNTGTINSIQITGDNCTQTIAITNNKDRSTSGSIGSISITGNGTRTVTIQNESVITGITATKIGGGTTLNVRNSGSVGTILAAGNGSTLNVQNDAGGTISSLRNNFRDGTINIDSSTATLTVRNDGTIETLTGVFANRITLQSGAGLYKLIESKEFDQFGLQKKLIEFSNYRETGASFYFPNNEAPEWRETYSGEKIENVIVSVLPFSIGMTAAADGTSVSVTPNGTSFTITGVTADQNVTLTGQIVHPENGLKSAEADMTYSWRYANETEPLGNGKTLPLETIQYGTHNLVLVMKDTRYNVEKTASIQITVGRNPNKNTTISLKIPAEEFRTKVYDGTTKIPQNMPIEFVDELGRVVSSVDRAHYQIDTSSGYRDPNCGVSDNTITVKVTLTTEGAKYFTLKEGGDTFTVPAAITRYGSDDYSLYYIELSGEYYVSLGESVLDNLTLLVPYYDAEKGHIYYRSITDGDTFTYSVYHLRPGSNTPDPALDELLTDTSVFSYTGDYKVYAIVEESQNYVGGQTGLETFHVNLSGGHERNHKHGSDEQTYTDWDGSGDVPVGTSGTAARYLSASQSHVTTGLALSQQKTFYLCLYGKTVYPISASYDHIFVTDGAHLILSDCTEAGKVKGSSGDIAHVKNGTLSIYDVTLTGGAVVVDEGGELNLYSGEISGNTVTSGNGGAIYIKSGGTANIYGGTIRDNHVYSGNGGAIYVAAGGTLNLYGGEITGNTASGLGGGIYVEEGGTLNVKGAPIVTGNKVSGADNNVYLPTGQLIIVTDTLESGAQIGVSTERKTYTPALTIASITPDRPDTQDCAAYFFPDDPNAAVFQSGKLLALGVGPTVTLDGTTLTVRPGSLAVSGGSLFVAEYGADGRMLRAQSLPIDTAETRYLFTVQAGTSIKCFLLDDNHRPLGKALSPL